MEELAELFSAVEEDFKNSILINIRFQDSSVIIHKRRLPVFTLGLNDRLNDTTNDLRKRRSFPAVPLSSLEAIHLMEIFWTGMTGTGMGLPSRRILPEMPGCTFC